MARRANVGEIVEKLTSNSSRGVLIVGSRGAGKTWILGQILAELDADAVTIRLSASKALSAIPFGAVNARVGVNLIRSNDYYEILNGLLEQINAATSAGHRVFLMVDNANHLDSQSAAIILQVVMSTEAKLILVDQPGGHNNHLRDLWRDGHLTRFELAPLQSEDVQIFLEHVLGGKVAGPAAEYLAIRSDGNPLVLQGLVAGAQEEGSLRKVNNVWVLDHPADLLGTESWEFLQMDLDHLPAESRRIIEILALAGPLPLDLLLDLTVPEAVDDIQQREMVEIIPGTTMSMRLARRATAPAIRAMVPVGRSRRLLAEVSRVLSPEEQTHPEAIINFTRWFLDCGLPVNENRILKATSWANQLMRPHEALQFSSTRVGDENYAILLAERAIAHLNQNRPQDARTLSLQALELAQSPEAAAKAMRAMHLSHFAEMDYEARFEAALARYEIRFGQTTLSESSTRADIELLTVLTMSDVSLGNVERATANIQALLKHPLTRSVSDQVHLKSLLCEIFRVTGQMSQSVATAMEVIAALENPEGFPRPDIAILAYSRAVAAFIYDGAWDHVRVALDPATFVNPDLLLYAGGLRDLAGAMMHSRRGYIEEALTALESAIGALNDYDPWSVMGTALGLKAYCLMMRGDLAGSQEYQKKLGGLSRRSGKFHELEGAAYAAAAQYMSGQSELGLARLRSVQRECHDKGYLGIELTALSLLVRAGDSEALGRLTEVASLLESSTKEFFVEWAEAVRSQDPAILDQASVTAMDYGFELIAVELATLALKKFHDSGKVHKSRKTASRVVAMREHLPGVVSPAFQSLDQPKMTRREHQIALLVAQGESNNSIATRLHVSLRTIEGHLYRTFIKLDIQSREQLAALMTGEASKPRSKVSHS
ncbi:LuxR C-terminal-related transcriptional regulator [Arthrobacter sp. E3]|uniref:LuxR C-terminal-related transcriptional regulator n=1 Tax=Arthrobacter sp. E3 TaxID=517402 RepID=UPI001A943475